MNGLRQRLLRLTGQDRRALLFKLGRLAIVVLLMIATSFFTVRIVRQDDLLLRALRAEMDKQELLEVLNGKVRMIESYPGSEWAMAATVEWEIYEVKK